MSRVSHFQRFSQRENHITNNTMLVLRHFYRMSTRKVEAVFLELMDEDISVGLSFEQQVKTELSVPDALISQSAFEVYFETKRGGELDKNQIRNHITSISSRSRSGARIILFGLTRSEISVNDNFELTELAMRSGVTFVSRTFSDLVQALQSVCDPFETELIEILSDYREFLAEEDLLKIGDVMTAVPCGTSMDENIQFRLYFEPAERYSKAKSRYIGLYSQKCIRYIGDVTDVVVGQIVGEEFEVSQVEVGSASPENLARIEGAIAACTYFPGFAEDEHRFYLFDQVEETNFIKQSKGGIWGPRVFNLSEMLAELDFAGEVTIEQVAGCLSGMSFE